MFHSKTISFKGIKLLALTEANGKKVEKKITLPDASSELTISGGKDCLSIYSPGMSGVFSSIHVLVVDNKSKLKLKEKAEVSIDRVNTASIFQHDQSRSTIGQLCDSKIILKDSSVSHVLSAEKGSKINQRNNSHSVITNHLKGNTVNLWENATSKTISPKGGRVVNQKTKINYEDIPDKLWNDLKSILGNNLTPMVVKAYNLALNAHKDQLRDCGAPYISHPLDVAIILAKELNITSEKSLSIALLHDVVEDTSVKINDIQKDFGSEVAKGVALLTKPVDCYKNKASEEKYYRDLQAGPVNVQLIKLADRLDNLRDLIWENDTKIKKQLNSARKRFISWSEMVNKDIADKIKIAINDISKTIS
ncbi:MAG: HD domain-containing protein [Cyanobacteriota bacterium]